MGRKVPNSSETQVRAHEVRRDEDHVERFFIEFGTYARPSLRQTNGELVPQGKPFVVLGHDVGDEHAVTSERLRAMTPSDAFTFAHQLLAAHAELTRKTDPPSSSPNTIAAPPMPSPVPPASGTTFFMSGDRVRIKATGEVGRIKSVGPGNGAIVQHDDTMMVRHELSELVPDE